MADTNWKEVYLADLTDAVNKIADQEEKLAAEGKSEKEIAKQSKILWKRFTLLGKLE